MSLKFNIVFFALLFSAQVFGQRKLGSMYVITVANPLTASLKDSIVSALTGYDHIKYSFSYKKERLLVFKYSSEYFPDTEKFTVRLREQIPYLRFDERNGLPADIEFESRDFRE